MPSSKKSRRNRRSLKKVLAVAAGLGAAGLAWKYRQPIKQKLQSLQATVNSIITSIKNYLSDNNIPQTNFRKTINDNMPKIKQIISEVCKRFPIDQDTIDIVKNELVESFMKKILRINPYTYSGQFLKKKSSRLIDLLINKDIRKLFEPNNTQIESILKMSSQEIVNTLFPSYFQLTLPSTPRSLATSSAPSTPSAPNSSAQSTPSTPNSSASSAPSAPSTPSTPNSPPTRRSTRSPLRIITNFLPNSKFP